MLWYENISYRDYNVYNDIPALLNEHPELNHTEAIIFLVNHDNGFGSNLTTIIQFSNYLKQINNCLHCLGYFYENGYNFKYHDINYNNSFFLYFKYLKEIPENIPYYFLSMANNQNIPFIIPQRIDDLNVNNIPINALFADHFKENFELKIDVSHVVKNIANIKNLGKPLIGIHIRSFAQICVEKGNTNHTIESRILLLKNKLDNLYGSYNIFLITDVSEYINIFKTFYLNTNVQIYYNDFISRIDNHGNGIDGPLYGYNDSMINLSEFTGIKLGSDILYDYVSLIHCDFYYVSVTNIAFITSFINKNNNGIHYN